MEEKQNSSLKIKTRVGLGGQKNMDGPHNGSNTNLLVCFLISIYGMWALGTERQRVGSSVFSALAFITTGGSANGCLDSARGEGPWSGGFFFLVCFPSLIPSGLRGQMYGCL